MSNEPDHASPYAPCRFCGRPLEHLVVDLGMSPLCESYVAAEDLDHVEPFYPLRVYVCGSCHLVQLAEYVAPEQIFGQYAYFSSYSDSWVEHARRFAETMTGALRLDGSRLVIEVGSNDGYLLQHFAALGVAVLGIEPAANVAVAAEARHVHTMVRFFGRALADELAGAGIRADLLVGNNVLAQVPDMNDFVAGLAILLAPDGLLTLEFPHLLRLLDENQFDTIYHEHFSYFSLLTAGNIMRHHGLVVVDVDEIPTHGGSLRLHVRHAAAAMPVSRSVGQLLDRERQAGLDTLDRYATFGRQVESTKRALLEMLIGLRSSGYSIAGYGAPGKANTLLNYCGIRTDFVDYTVDRNPYKQGRYTPGTHIPIMHPDHIRETKPDYVWIMPWNLRGEIADQLAYVRDWGGRLMVAIPRAEVLP
jgi:SAM-dependent methyltransferase